MHLSATGLPDVHKLAIDCVLCACLCVSARRQAFVALCEHMIFQQRRGTLDESRYYKPAFSRSPFSMQPPAVAGGVLIDPPPRKMNTPFHYMLGSVCLTSTIAGNGPRQNDDRFSESATGQQTPELAAGMSGLSGRSGSRQMRTCARCAGFDGQNQARLHKHDTTLADRDFHLAGSESGE